MLANLYPHSLSCPENAIYVKLDKIPGMSESCPHLGSHSHFHSSSKDYFLCLTNVQPSCSVVAVDAEENEIIVEDYKMTSQLHRLKLNCYFDYTKSNFRLAKPPSMMIVKLPKLDFLCTFSTKTLERTDVISDQGSEDEEVSDKSQTKSGFH